MSTAHISEPRGMNCISVSLCCNSSLLCSHVFESSERGKQHKR